MPTPHSSRFAGRALAALLAAILPATAASAADSDPSRFALHGFGTLGEVYSDSRYADFVGNTFQPNGAGYTRSWAAGVDSKFGLQVDARITDKLTATLQLVSQLRYDDTWKPQIEWANLKYQFTPDFSIRAGRTAADFFLLSDQRLVGYTYPWIRPPEEIYGQSPLTNEDGIGFNYRVHFGEVTNWFKVTYGRTKARLPAGAAAQTGKRFFASSATVEKGAFTFRAAYESFRVDVQGPTLSALFTGISQFGATANAFGFTATGAEAVALGDQYRLNRVPYAVTTVGVNYDPGGWLLTAEWARLDASAALASETAWYVTGGYRFGNFMPYLTIARLRADTKSESSFTTAGLPPPLAAGATALNAGLAALLNSTAYSQDTVSVGARWDFAKDLDFKMQYDRLKLGENSRGRLFNVQPDFQPGGTVNAVSVGIDFVF